MIKILSYAVKKRKKELIEQTMCVNVCDLNFYRKGGDNAFYAAAAWIR